MAPKYADIKSEDLRNWRMIEDFLDTLEPIAKKNPRHRTFDDPRRTLDCAGYLGLFLFGLFNPVVQTMRQLCAISHLDKVRKSAHCPAVSVGSFSAAQAVIDPDLLKQVFEILASRIPRSSKADRRLQHLDLIAQDGSLWSALPRMAWAQYGVGPKGEANGVRLHLRFNILKDAPEDAIITEGKASETEALRQMLLPGQTNVGDRGYGKSYRLFRAIDQAGAFFVLRLKDDAVIEVEETLPISAADQQAGVVRHAWVYLGATPQLRSMRLRLVEVRMDGHRLLLVTNHSLEQLSAELVALVYRRRWSIELFFRWIKCILGTRHFFAESENGVAIQLYLALIAGLLLQLFVGERPNRRVMDLLQFYFLGWATAEELTTLIPKYMGKGKSAQKV